MVSERSTSSGYSHRGAVGISTGTWAMNDIIVGFMMWILWEDLTHWNWLKHLSWHGIGLYIYIQNPPSLSTQLRYLQWLETAETWPIDHNRYYNPLRSFTPVVTRLRGHSRRSDNRGIFSWQHIPVLTIEMIYSRVMLYMVRKLKIVRIARRSMHDIVVTSQFRPITWVPEFRVYAGISGKLGVSARRCR